MKAEMLQKQLNLALNEREEMTKVIGEDPSQELVNTYYSKKVSELLAELQYANGRALYYKEECTSLIAGTIALTEENSTVETKLTEMERACNSLKDELESTRTNYEEQMRSLYEHLAAQNAKIVEQSESISLLQAQSNTKKTENGGTSLPSLKKMVRK
jgi:chromosome segregation ATPase